MEYRAWSSGLIHARPENLSCVRHIASPLTRSLPFASASTSPRAERGEVKEGQSVSTSQPLGDAALRIRARLGIAADMAALRRACIGSRQRMQRKTGAVEFMERVRVHHDARQRAASP